jgi:hypothetical protein
MKRIIVYALIVGVFCLLSLKYFSAPWIWIFVSVIIFLLTLAFTAKKQRSKVVLFNVLALPVALLLAESYSYFDPFKERIIRTGTLTTDGFSKSNELLGYAPIPGIQRTLKVMVDDEVIYDVTYTINNNGLRSTPSSNNSSAKCLLFFGGSFTFGQGLNDDETLPYFMGKELNENYRIFNFGFDGYGPHQMLSAIEHGLVDNITKECQQIDAIYSSVPGHIARTAGYSLWDTHGPKYVIDNDALIYKGHFGSEADPPRYFVKRVEAHLRKSLLYKKIFFTREYITTEDQKDTFIAIIERSQHLLREINSASRFIIVFWEAHNLSSDVNKNDSNIIRKKLSNKGFQYYLIGNILAGYKNDAQRYSISPHDPHPSAEANRLLAKYLITKLEHK